MTPFELDEFTPYLLSAASERLSADLTRVYADRFGISNAEWRVLVHLAADAEISVRDIHRRTSMDKVKVSRAAARLQAARLIAKEVNKADQRLVVLKLTPKGRNLFEAISPLALAYEEEALAKLTLRERKALRGILRKLAS